MNNAGKHIAKYLILVIVLLLCNGFYRNLLSAKNNSDTLSVKKCQDFDLTGDGSNIIWKSTEWIPVQQRTNKTETYSTNAKILYSENGIYVLFDCSDKKLISTKYNDNLSLWEDDVVEVFLWTQEDFPVYFEYELSPLNYELPLIIPNNKGVFMGWSPWQYEGDRKTRHAVSVKGGKSENGSQITSWTAELFIPFSLLKPLPQVPPKSGTTWRGNLYRIDYDQGMTLFSWNRIEKSFHEYNNFGTFIFE
ncbi:MAG TPA: carbohydrate-binding family 9-like protein [Draconibacterium sp.]|nr:carbohydrate-binding family 9-like protein [Draconibacterium sp.]